MTSAYKENGPRPCLYTDAALTTAPKEQMQWLTSRVHHRATQGTLQTFQKSAISWLLESKSLPSLSILESQSTLPIRPRSLSQLSRALLSFPFWQHGKMAKRKPSGNTNLYAATFNEHNRFTSHSRPS